MKKLDFKRLQADLWAACIRHPDDPEPKPEMVWEMGYPGAIAASLEQDDFRQLIDLLKQKRPIHPMLLPALAQALENRGRPKKSGQKSKLTSLEKSAVALMVQLMRRRSMTLVDACAEMGERYGVSPETIKRAYNENKPTKYRPGQN